MIQLQLVCRLRGFPDLALIRLTVTADAVGISVTAEDAVAQGDTQSRRHALPQGAGRHIHARCFAAVRMAGQVGARFIYRLKPFHREIPLQGQHGVERRAAVPLRQHQSVTILPFRIGRVDLHHAAVKNSQNIRDGRRAADMAEAGPGNSFGGFLADLGTKTCQFLKSCMFAQDICHLFLFIPVLLSCLTADVRRTYPHVSSFLASAFRIFSGEAGSDVMRTPTAS